ncbi:MAG: hypothetical protein N2652_09265 [Kiritimatiellae bacterium]|nr:hypothetical protein [Kiritimatiellia bacterium]
MERQYATIRYGWLRVMVGRRTGAVERRLPPAGAPTASVVRDFCRPYVELAGGTVVA